MISNNNNIINKDDNTMMMSLDNDPLGLLFLLDDRLVPTYLDYAQCYGHGLDQEVLFLLEVDRLRFNSSNNDNENTTNTNKDVNDTIEFMSRIINYNCINATNTNAIITMNDYDNIAKLITTKIPLKASFAEICERIWMRVLVTTEKMPLSSNWTALRKCLIDDTNSYIPEVHSTDSVTNRKFELFTILNDEHGRKYFHEYLLKKNNINTNNTSYNKNIDLISYHCWLGVRDILVKLEKLKANNYDNNSNDNDNDNINDNNDHNKPSPSEYIDNFEAFKLLLKEMRLLHKRFGFTMLPSSSSSSSPSSNKPMYSTSASPTLPSSSSSIALQKLSPAICIELSATLTLCSSISLDDIESVDHDFATSCLVKFQKLLIVLERETFQHLQKQFEGYMQSLEFVRMIIRQKCHSNANTNTTTIPQLKKYIRTIEFLESIVKLPGSMLRPHAIFYDSEIEGMASNVLISYKTIESLANNEPAIIPTATATTNTTTNIGNIICIYSELETTDIHNFSISNIRVLKGLQRIESSKVAIDIKYMEQDNDNNSTSYLKVVLHVLKHLGKIDISSKTFIDDDSKFSEDNSTIYSNNMNIGPSSSLMKISMTKNKTLYDAIQKFYPNDDNTVSINDMIIQVGYAFESSSSSSRYQLGLVISLPSSSTPTALVRMIRDVAVQTVRNGHSDHFKVTSIDLNLAPSSSSSSSPAAAALPSRQESLKDLYPYAYKDDNGTCYNPVPSLLGPADFSLCRLILSSSLRLVIHILFLLLTNKNVVLISQSTTLLSEFMLALPRLCIPFRLYNTHDFDMLMQLDLIEIWWSNILSGDLKRSFFVGLKADIFYTSSMYKYLLYNQASTMAKLDMTDAEKYSSIEESFDMIVVDLDKSTIIFPSVAQTLLSTLSSSLSPSDESDNINDDDNMIYQLPFSFCFSHVTLQFKSGPFLELNKTLQSLHNQNTVNVTIENNNVETAWFKYFSNIILKEIPQQIVHYPTQKVIGCNIDNILKNLYKDYLHRRSLKYDYENIDTYGLKSGDIEVYFLNDIVSNLRPSFLDIIIRHGTILKNFRFS